MRYQLIFCAILTFSLFFCSCKSQKESVSVINEEDSESLVLEHIIDNIEQSSENLILIKKAKEWLGTPYRFAHSEKGKGTDCSGMVMELFKDVFDIKLPRNAEKQAEFCLQVRKGLSLVIYQQSIIKNGLLCLAGFQLDDIVIFLNIIIKPF